MRQEPVKAHRNRHRISHRTPRRAQSLTASACIAGCAQNCGHPPPPSSPPAPKPTFGHVASRRYDHPTGATPRCACSEGPIHSIIEGPWQVIWSLIFCDSLRSSKLSTATRGGGGRRAVRVRTCQSRRAVGPTSMSLRGAGAAAHSSVCGRIPSSAPHSSHRRNRLGRARCCRDKTGMDCQAAAPSGDQLEAGVQAGAAGVGSGSHISAFFFSSVLRCLRNLLRHCSYVHDSKWSTHALCTGTTW